MNLTQLIRRLQSQLRNTERLTQKYNSHADFLRKKLADIAHIAGRTTAVQMSGTGRSISLHKKHRGISAAGRARIVAAQHRRWAKFHARKSK